MKAFITGGAGFIGSHLVEHLLTHGDTVVVYDNYSSVGNKLWMGNKNDRLIVIKADVLDKDTLISSMKGCDSVFHFSANADVRKGIDNRDIDLKQNILATHNVLEGMIVQGVSRIIFPSSMTVYGRVTGDINESYGPYMPISMYAASKLSCEGMISAYAAMYGITSWIVRLANVVGIRSTHGVIYDLIHKLLLDSKKLHVLGDGYQQKPYIYIDDAVDGMMHLLHNVHESVNIYNLGVSDQITVREIVAIILQTMELPSVDVSYESKTYGWKGDVPTFRLDITKAIRCGFHPTKSSVQAVQQAVRDCLIDVRYARTV